MTDTRIMHELDKGLLVDTIIDQQKTIQELRKQLEWQERVSRSNLARYEGEKVKVRELRAELDGLRLERAMG